MNTIEIATVNSSDTQVRRPLVARIAARSRRMLAAAVLVPALVIGIAGPAAAETDRPSEWCGTVNGVTRGCVSAPSITWGSGWSWRAFGGAYATFSGWTARLEVKLDRQAFVSDTSWMRLGSSTYVNGSIAGHESLSGSDPTDGAWFRLALVSPGGSTYYTPTRYVQDNS